MKKIVIIGAEGAIGKKIKETFLTEEFEIISVGKSSGQYQVNIDDVESVKALYAQIGKFDALVCAAGNLALAPLQQLERQHWDIGLNSKLMGQINLVQQGIAHINEGGSFTLVSGIGPISQGGAVAMVVNKGIEAYAISAACEMPKGIRINVVSPNMITESETIFRPFFPGGKSVPGSDVALAFKRSVMGVQTGQVFKVH